MIDFLQDGKLVARKLTAVPKNPTLAHLRRPGLPA